MGNMCCRREVYAPNGTEADQSRCGHQQQSIHQQHLSKHQVQQHPAMSSAYHSAGDDCAINELLEGRMDLDVLMPDGRQVRLTVERRTPMMDLLVQAASATKISPGGHVIHVFGDGDKGNGAIHYKPSTPIGSLDTKTICIVPKKEVSDHLAKRTAKTTHRPFEPTFRVQVHLPRNQLTVLRVLPRIKIADLKAMICKEKGLDTSRYQLVRPSGPTQPLAGDMTLAEYGSTEITLLSNISIESHICNSTSHIIPYSKRAEESKRKNGILRLLTEDVINKVNETPNCDSTFRINNHHHEKTGTTEDAHVHQYKCKPKKRRPAPAPPPPVLPEAPSHSRQSSSDSSGYHEATSSFLHEEHSSEEKASSDSSGVSSLDAKMPAVQPSPPPPVPNSKKKKAPAPPPPPTRLKERTTHRPAPARPPSKTTNSLKSEDSKVKTDVEEFTAPLKNSSKTDRRTGELGCSVQSIEDHIGFLPAVKIEANSTDVSRKSYPITEFTIPCRPELSDHQNNSSIPSKGSIKDPLIPLQTLESEADNNIYLLRKSPSPIAEFTISTYSETERSTDRVISEDDLIQKDNPLTRENNNVGDRISTTGDHIIAADHVILKDPVPKRDTDIEKKLDLPYLWESEGHQLRQQPQMTVAAKALPASNGPATGPFKDRDIKHETSLDVTESKDNAISVVPDTCKYKTSERKSQEQLSYKGEAVSTRVALVALNARIEQDVTQQEIASSIQAAFHSVDFSPQPSLLAIKQRNSDHSIPERSLPLESQTTILSVPVGSGKEIQGGTPSAQERLPEKEALLTDEDPVTCVPVSTRRSSTKNLKRSSSLLNFTDVGPRNNASVANPRRARQLQRSLTDLSTDGNEDFEAEQQRLQREYIKLQRQFLVWQQQLMNNHAMLREECIVPQYARTLRQSHSLPEGEDSFEDTTPSIPLVSRSLSYEPTKDRCSTLPRSAINITSLEFGSIPLTNGTSTLRSSKTKSYFKPPQVRASTKSRQRLPPEIKREGDVDITDDAKMLTTILPSFESLKLITENHGEETHFGISRLRDTSTPSIPAEGRKVPVVHLSATFPKLNSKANNVDKATDRDLKCVNGNAGQSLFRTDCLPKRTVEQSHSKSNPPPPPPPPHPMSAADSGVSKCTTVIENCAQSSGQRNGVTGKKDFTSHADPRDQLMLEIRKFGGRTALRKISLAS